MTHDDVLEQLQLAAVEPGGLDRLIAGDTPEAAAIAGHLAACRDCTREFDDLRRSTMLIKAVIATQPPAELRERTLAFVAAVGRPRGAAVAAPAAASIAAPAAVPVVEPMATPAPVVAAVAEPISLEAHRSSRERFLRRRPATWLLATAALLVLAVGLTAGAVSNLFATQSRQASLEIAGLAEVATWTAHIEAEPDVQHVILTSANAGGRSDLVGSLIFSGSKQEVVVIADGLSDPGPNQQYACWVEVNGQRQRLGRMYVSDDLGYWVGDSPALAYVPPGSTFGVNLVDASGSGANQAVMSGTLQGS
jgi:hypothetical protein